MKIDDFLEVVDNYAAFPKWRAPRIYLYASEEDKPDDWFLSFDPNEDYLNLRFKWAPRSISKEGLVVVSNALTELLMTPVSERF